jgi:uncharacterized protein (TIGR02118 family)
MYKFIAAVHRREDLTKEQFREHYRNKHGPLIKSSRGFRRHLVRYVQHETVVREGRHFLDEPDCVSALYFYDLDSFNAAFEEPDYIEAIRADERRFISFDSLILGAATELVLKNPPAANSGSNKLMIYRKPGPGMSAQEFNAHWLSSEVPQLSKTEAFGRFVKGHVINQFLPPSLRTQTEFLVEKEQFAMLEEFWFDSQEAAATFCEHLEAEWPSRNQANEKRSDEIVMRVREREVFGPKLEAFTESAGWKP